MDTIKIKIETNAQDAGKSFESFDKSLKKTTTDAEDLRKQIKGLKQDLFKLEPGTAEYTKTLNELGKKMDQYNDTMREARAATGQLDTVFETTTRATASLAGGFSAAIGIVTLFGSESESLMKVLVKLQAVMNITKGLKEFASFFKYFDQASVAIKSYANQVTASNNEISNTGAILNTASSAMTASAAATTSASAAATASASAELSNAAATNMATKAAKENVDTVLEQIAANKELKALYEELVDVEIEQMDILAESHPEYIDSDDVEESTLKVKAHEAALEELAEKYGVTAGEIEAATQKWDKADQHVYDTAKARVEEAEKVYTQYEEKLSNLSFNDDEFRKWATENIVDQDELMKNYDMMLAKVRELEPELDKAAQQEKAWNLAVNESVNSALRKKNVIVDELAVQSDLNKESAKTVATLEAEAAATTEGAAASAGAAAAGTANAIAKEENAAASTENTIAENAESKATQKDTAAKVANTAATESNTKATIKNAGANKTNASTLGGVFPMFKMLKERLVSIISLLKGFSAVTWGVIGVVGAFVGALAYMYKQSKAVREQLEKTAETERILNKDMVTLEESMENVRKTTDWWTGDTLILEKDLDGLSKRIGALTDRLTDYEKRMNSMIDGYKKLGASEELVNKVTLIHTRSLLEQARATYESEMALTKQYATSKKTADLWEHHNELAKEAAELVKKYEQAMNDLNNVNVPQWMLDMNTAYEKFNREIQRAVNQGVMTEGQGIQKQIDKAKGDLKAFNDMLDDWYSGDSARVTAANKRAHEMGLALSESDNIDAEKDILENRIKYFTEQLEDYNDKAVRSLAQSSAATVKKSNEELKKALKELDLKKLYEEYKKQMEAFQSLTGDSDMTDETAQARLYQWQVDFKKRLDEFVKTQTEAAQKLNLTKKDYATFISELQKKVTDFENFMANSAFPFPPELDAKVKEMQELMVKESQTFVRLNDNISALVKEGRITTQEYTNWLEDYITKYQDTIKKNAEEGNSIIDTVLESMNVSEDEKESLRLFWSELFDFSDNLLPPESAKAIESAVTEMIDTAFAKIENEFEGRKDRFSIYWEDMNRSWLEGGQNTSYWGDSATASFNKMQKQAEDLYKILHEEYTQEAAAIQEKMNLLDENSEAYKQYFQKLAELRQADADAQAQYETSSIAAARQYGQNIVATTQEFTDAVSGLAGALGSYYAEQKDAAAEMYGENSAEYQKYLKKEGNMKIAQVWIDWATGVMSAWATSETLGPIAGPILAAIQTAALTATAVASTQQIKRQSKASNNGGGTTANVGQLTDRVIYGDAQTADQQAELNGMYNQGYTRVYVTATDISDKQGENKTAVTNNRF